MSAMIDINALNQEMQDFKSKGWIPEWYTLSGWQIFRAAYWVKAEEAVRGRFETISRVLARHLPFPYNAHYEKKFFNEMWEGRLSPSSPVLSNTGTNRGDIVSCSGQYIGDSVDSFYRNLHETAILSKRNYGTSWYGGAIRPRGSKFGESGKANGQYAVIEDFFTCTEKISQGGLRKGAGAANIHLDSPDFYECLWALKKKPKGKNFAWIVTDKVTEFLKQGDPEMSQRWKDALHVKILTGKGYLFFVDKANRHRPQMYKDLGLDIVATNLCVEIMLHSSEELTYSCVLASLNAVHWDTIESSDSVQTATIFLDCVISEYLRMSQGVEGLEKIRAFTEKGRAIGLGWLGVHTYLQSKMIPYSSLDAQHINYKMYKHLHDESLKASQWLAELLGEPEWCKGYGVRNTHRTAQAPNKTTASLMGVSESNVPEPAMVYASASIAGEVDQLPVAFKDFLIAKGQYTPEVIQSIIANLGSVQHLDWMTPHEKAVFRNAFEEDQWIILRRAKQRQKWLCQGQSLNFFISEETREQSLTDLLSACVLEEDILSVYYGYFRSGVVVLDECINCQA